MDVLIDYFSPESNKYCGQAVLQKKIDIKRKKYITKHWSVLENIVKRAAFGDWIVISLFQNFIQKYQKLQQQTNQAQGASTNISSSLILGFNDWNKRLPNF